MRSFFFLGVFTAAAFAGSVVKRSPLDQTLFERQAEPPAGALVDFQVYEPVLTPSGDTDEYGCVYTKVLMEYDFANSYGVPFVGMQISRS